MANFALRLPATNFRSFSISASSNGNGSLSLDLCLCFSVASSFFTVSFQTGAAPGNHIGKSQNGGPVILELPLDKIRRPLLRTRANDPNKVQELMDSIKQIGLQVPVCVYRFWFLCNYFSFSVFTFV